MVDRLVIEKHFPDKDFSSYPLQPANKSPYIKVILGEKDEVLDFRKALEFFEDREFIILPNEGHRLKNLKPLIEFLVDYIAWEENMIWIDKSELQ